MNFILDEHLPPRFVDWFDRHNCTAIHVRRMVPPLEDDALIAQLAMTGSAVIVSKDEDFVALQMRHGFRLIRLRCGNISNPGLRDLFDRYWPDILSAFERGETLIELR